MKKARPANFIGGVSNAERFHCTAPSIGLNMDQHYELMEFLPKDYQYHVCRYKAVSQPSGFDHISFEATLRMSLQSKEDILVWLKSMPVTWRVDYVRPSKGQKTIFKNEYRCQHKTRTAPKPGRVSKNTHCDAKLKVTLVRTVDSSGRLSRSTDPHIPAYPTIVEMKNIHNHNIHGSEAVRHRDVGAAAVEKLTTLFETGHSPSSALEVLKCDLQLEYGDDYITKSADRSICPDLRFCYRLYDKIFRAEYGSAEGNGMFAPVESDSEMLDPLESDSEVSEDAETSVQLQPLASSTMAATEGLKGAEASDVFDRERFCSNIDKFKETVLNNEGLQGGALDMMKTLDKVMGNPSLLLSAMRRFGRYGTNSRASQSGTSS